MRHKKLLVALLVLAIVAAASAFVAVHAVEKCHDGDGGFLCKVFHVAV